MRSLRPRRPFFSLFVLSLVLLGDSRVAPVKAGFPSGLTPGEGWASARSQSYTLVNSVFASGASSSPAASASYRLIGVLGEGGLPSGTTVVSSSSFRYQPGFLAAAPAVGTSLYLPLVNREFSDSFAGPAESEPNDTYVTANGPIILARTYTGAHSSGSTDDRDFYRFIVSGTGAISIALTNVLASAQLTLYDSTGTKAIGFSGGAPYIINQTNAAAGVYFVRVFTPANYNSNQTYSLMVTFP